jgi:hypothetical protein
MRLLHETSEAARDRDADSTRLHGQERMWILG